MNSRGQTFSTTALVISVVVIITTLYLVSLIPRRLPLGGVDELLVKGELYTLTVNALANASKGGSFTSFLQEQLQYVSQAYIPVLEASVEDATISEGLSRCTVSYRTPYGVVSFTVYLQLELLSQSSSFDPASGLYVVTLEVRVTCDQYYPRSVKFWTSYKTSWKRQGEVYVVEVSMETLAPFTLYCEDWRGVRTYINVSP